MSQPDPEPHRLEIRKYPNRRYYDATRSRHLTLEEIHSAIREGYEIRVIDSRTGEDITAKVLAQIIIDLDPPKLEVFPVPLLHGLLRANQKMVGSFIDRYFNQPLSMFLDSQRSFENYIRTAMGLPGGVPTVADWTRMMWGPLAGGGWGPRPASAAESSPPPVPPPPANGEPEPAAPAPAVAESPAGEPAAAAPEADPLRTTVDRLTRQVAELESRLGRKSRRKARKTR